MIEVQYNYEEITSIIINGEKLESDDGEVWFLPKGLIAGLKVSDLPDTVSFQPCRYQESSAVVLDSIPMLLRRIAPNKIRVEFENSERKKYWDGKIGLNEWMNAMHSTVEEREKEVGDIHFESYDDDGPCIRINYSAEIETDSVEILVQLAEQIVDEVYGAAEMRVGGHLDMASVPTNEEEFTLRVVLPILRKLGFANIKYNHGKREYGKDIVFARISEFQEIEHWAAQVKYGNVTGGAGSDIDKLISQAEDAFMMPFYDIYTRQQQRICKLVIIASGKFTENAIQKICDKIESHSLRNNLVFIDGDKIDTLAERFRSAT